MSFFIELKGHGKKKYDDILFVSMSIAVISPQNSCLIILLNYNNLLTCTLTVAPRWGGLLCCDCDIINKYEYNEYDNLRPPGPFLSSRCLLYLAKECKNKMMA